MAIFYFSSNTDIHLYIYDALCKKVDNITEMSASTVHTPQGVLKPCSPDRNDEEICFLNLVKKIIMCLLMLFIKVRTFSFKNKSCVFLFGISLKFSGLFAK